MYNFNKHYLLFCGKIWVYTFKSSVNIIQMKCKLSVCIDFGNKDRNKNKKNV